jgi:hypothetical protein
MVTNEIEIGVAEELEQRIAPQSDAAFLESPTRLQ